MGSPQITEAPSSPRQAAPRSCWAAAFAFLTCSLYHSSECSSASPPAAQMAQMAMSKAAQMRAAAQTPSIRSIPRGAATAMPLSRGLDSPQAANRLGQRLLGVFRPSLSHPAVALGALTAVRCRCDGNQTGGSSVNSSSCSPVCRTFPSPACPTRHNRAGPLTPSGRRSSTRMQNVSRPGRFQASSGGTRARRMRVAFEIRASRVTRSRCPQRNASSRPTLGATPSRHDHWSSPAAPPAPPS
jgi:hypothetical protein